MQTEKILICSTAHFTQEDNALLSEMAGQAAFCPWVVNLQYGYIIVLTNYRWRLQVLKSQGVSKALRRFLIYQIKRCHVSYVHFDGDAPPVSGWQTFDR